MSIFNAVMIAFLTFLAGLQNGPFSQTITVSSALKLSLLSTNSVPDPYKTLRKERNTVCCVLFCFFFFPKGIRFWKITQKNISRILKIPIFAISITTYLENYKSIIFKK